MIVSHDYKCIFLKVGKTASSSIELAMEKICKHPKDVVTPVTNYQKYNPNFKARNWLYPNGRRKFRKHMSARKARKHLPAKIWDNYFKFCFERNPWDRVISYWWHEHTIGKVKMSLNQFVFSDRILLLEGHSGWDIYTINNKVVLDKVYLYRNLQNSLKHISKRTGMPLLQLPHAKAQFRKDRRPFQKVLSRKAIEHIAKIFHKEIEMFGFKA